MLNIGMTELLAFGIISLLVLGPDKLPEAARFAGKWFAKIKRMISNVQNDIDRELRLSELREQMQQEMQRIQELEQKMQAQMHELQQQSQLAAEEQAQNAVPHNKNAPTFYIFIQSQQPCSIYLKTPGCAKQTMIQAAPLNSMPASAQFNPLKVAV
ncbi:twin-arginine translocase subunit TatB [Acinetobacter sp. C_4_1]|uniref:Sec-independent protein translocase protein TatB n=1 Tax=unclassified Acinetobacter TaxID=196816 RepID=UPI0021B78CD9|nr:MULTISPECIES: Sec-independent protein translocase protein TatB [unclassified Acinetobacter]MCT8090663.1 twin-arginine translocase subunit TatB [Acinetobacter sp. F_3_1]MCT8099141.1 twin-arginine translocase subunit TatB [Acinetobacter sp. C_3_1]MCT8102214.1 twin-arginine translocase subunit TatB [Acinetobacter sp. C_4_1]MCT8135961.1 twin-arginine translocase subunit TatB [Acinetobacter sp. T_3_1]